jgi:hypothetical protein
MSLFGAFASLFGFCHVSMCQSYNNLTLQVFKLGLATAKCGGCPVLNLAVMGLK